jgi:tetratricopeptide (TPR) repeat protein
MLLSTQGEYESARPLYERALETLEGALGRDHPSLAPILGDSALALASSGALEAARSHYEHALETQEAAVGADHPEVALILNNLGRLQLHTGERAAALAAGLRSEGITRNHLRLTIRSLPERQALRYAAARVSGLDLALTAAGLEPDPQSSRLVWDALIRSRGVVLDEMAARHRAAAATEKSEVARRSHHLASARTKLANLALRGPGGQSVERYQTAIELAHQEKERAEAALADLSEAFRDELARAQVGITQVADALPGGSALIAHALHDRPAPPSVEPTRAGEVAFFQPESCVKL